jgi:hypothetical protein
MNHALRHLIGKICHVYLDDIIIWSQTLEDHEKNVESVLLALCDTHLLCSLKKTLLFCTEVNFLRHHISARGIEPDTSKIEKITNWKPPQSAKEVHQFLSLVRYVAIFLPKLADFTHILTPLTSKTSDALFPTWTAHHEATFLGIKSLVLSTDCLTTIDHINPGPNRIFVTCDASDWRTGAVLSFGETWETS